MKKHQGNIIIFFVIVLIIIALFMLFSLKNKIQAGWSTSKDKNQNNETYQKSPAPQPQPKPQPQPQPQPQNANQNETYEYYNDISYVQNNEMLNPFLSTYSKNPTKPHSNTTNTKAPNLTKAKANTNLINTAPNGHQLPSQTSYLNGYPVKNQNGKLNITINNSLGHSNLIVLLYLKKPYSDQKNTDLNTIFAATYVSAGDDFNFTKVPSGHYRIVWINLANKKAFKSALS